MKKKTNRETLANILNTVEHVHGTFQFLERQVNYISTRINALLEEIGKQKQDAQAAAKVLDAAVAEIACLINGESLAAKESFIGAKHIDRREAFEQALEIITRHKRELRWN